MIIGFASSGLSPVLANEPPPRVTLTQQQDDAETPPSQRGWRSWWGRRSTEFLKNHSSIKTAYRAATSPVAQSIVELLGDDKPVALGTIVDPAGLIVTKASLLAGKISVRLPDGSIKEAKLKAANTDYDVALLQIDATGLTPVVWRNEPTTPGTLVAAVASDGDAIGIGVISAGPREISGPRRAVRQRAWLGVTLGRGVSGTGVSDVMSDSAASRAGVANGDEILSIDGTAMQTMEQVIETIRSHEVGDTLTMVVRRDGKEMTLSPKLIRPPIGASPEDQWGGGPFSERRTGFPSVLPHDTAVLPNQCGGPLVDTDGKVVGINIARALRVTTYAIPADTMQNLVSELKSRG
jgi:serine protease Do